MRSILNCLADSMWGFGNQIKPLLPVKSTEPCKVMVVPEVNLEQFIEVAKEMGTYQKVHIGTPGMPRPPWHPDFIPVAKFSMPHASSAWSVVRAVSFNQRTSLDEVKSFARTHDIVCASAFEHIALDIQYPQVTDGISLISFDNEHCSVRLMSCGSFGNRELFVGPLMPNPLRSEGMHWLLR